MRATVGSLLVGGPDSRRELKGFRVWVWDLGFGVQGLGFRVWDSGFGVQGLGSGFGV